MQVRKQHHEDSGPGFRYLYDLYEFAVGDIVLIARSYDSEPDEAHLLGMRRGEQRLMLDESTLCSDLVQAAIEHLRGDGKARISWLADDGYREL